jgi:hypothetical protein
MQLRLEQRVPLSKLHIIEEMSSPLRRKAKIHANRLPDDFFAHRHARAFSRNQVHTQGLPRRVSQSERESPNREERGRPGCLTARAPNESEPMDLLRGVISTSR